MVCSILVLSLHSAQYNMKGVESEQDMATRLYNELNDKLKKFFDSDLSDIDTIKIKLDDIFFKFAGDIVGLSPVMRLIVNRLVINRLAGMISTLQTSSYPTLDMYAFGNNVAILIQRVCTHLHIEQSGIISEIASDAYESISYQDFVARRGFAASSRAKKTD